MKRIRFSLIGLPLVCLGVAMIVAAYFIGRDSMNYLGPSALIIILIGVAGFSRNAAHGHDGKEG